MHHAETPQFQGRVLVVEDDPDNLMIISLRLKKFGLDVIEVTNYEDAIQKMEKEQFDLIFSDFNLTGKHGGLILKYYIQKHLQCPFYFSSCYISMIRPDMRDNFLSKATGWLEKPYPENQILEVLQKHLPLKAYSSSLAS